MRVWLVTVGEELPTDAGTPRLLRTGLLAQYLQRKGHSVVWWTSTFNHHKKMQRSRKNTTLHVGAGMEIRLLRSFGYKRNVSLARLVDHCGLALAFEIAARHEPLPDVIVVSLPPLELAAAVSRYGKRCGVPIVLDVRDLWPDVFVDLVPGRARRALGVLCLPLARLAGYSCRAARAIIGPTRQYVQWGLDQARRPASSWDRDFPFGYDSQPPDADESRRADCFWKSRGVTKKQSEMIVCFFGVLGRHFDFETVIQAAGVLEERGAGVRFLLCGEGEKADSYRNAAAAYGSVTFPGWVGRAEILSLMRIADVGIAPYQPSENFLKNLPNKTVEYLSAGLPIVTCLQGVLGRLITDHKCGTLYKEGDPISLANELMGLKANPEKMRTLSGNASSLYERSFRADQVYPDMVRYLEEIGASALNGSRGEGATRRASHEVEDSI